MTNRKQDPTGQARNRRSSDKVLSRRLAAAEKSVKGMFRIIPRSLSRKSVISNAEQTAFYSYELTAGESEELQREIQFVINENLLETQADRMPFDWYWKEEVESPYRQGALEESRDFNQSVLAAIAIGALSAASAPQASPPEQILFSEGYRQALNRLQVDNFATIRTLSQRTASQVIQVINSGIDGGQSPRFITNEISARFQVAQSSAKRIADTEINRAYNNARLDATKILGDQTGLRAGVIHISALLPTTRDNHAARHGNAYTVEGQRQWWDSGSNRINCHCSTRSVLIDRQGNVIDRSFQDALKDQKSFFDS